MYIIHLTDEVLSRIFAGDLNVKLAYTPHPNDDNLEVMHDSVFEGMFLVTSFTYIEMHRRKDSYFLYLFSEDAWIVPILLNQYKFPPESLEPYEQEQQPHYRTALENR